MNFLCLPRECHTHRAFSSHQCLRRILRLGLGQNVSTLDSCTKLDSPATVFARPIVFLDPLDLLEIMRSDDKGSPACASADEVVARVPDDQSEAMVSGKLQPSLDVMLGLGINHIDTIVPQRARGSGIIRRLARVVCEVFPQQHCILLDAVQALVSTQFPPAGRSN